MKNKNILNEVKFTLKDGKRKFLDKKLYKNILNERPCKKNNKIYGAKVFCEHLKQKEMSFGKAFAIVIGAVLVFGVLFPILQHAVDTNALNNCKEHGDCAEVIRDINAH